jgi:uncharacterized protein YhbP (UPF0306 family)
MTLATARSDVAWAAPVYYVFFKSIFYFLSAPESRHIKEALENGRASSVIYASGSTWQEIRGLQMSGSIQPVEGRLEAFQALRVYLKKFPFTKEFFKKIHLWIRKAFGSASVLNFTGSSRPWYTIWTTGFDSLSERK